MIIYHLFKDVNEEIIHGEYFAYLSDAKMNLETLNEKEEKRFNKWKLAHQLRGKTFHQTAPDRWRIEEIEVHE